MLNIETKMAGEYKVLVTRNGKVVEETDWFDNIILDIGLDRVGTQGSIGYARVGTGTSTPVASQVQLDSQIASTASALNNANAGVTNSGAPNYITTQAWAFSFAQGAVVGNITELGVGWATSGATLFSRALILNNLGNPTSITITAIDQLTVYYRLRIIPTLTDSTGTVTISSVPYNYTARIGNATTFNSDSQLFRIDTSFGFLKPAVSAAARTTAAGTALTAITTLPAFSGNNGTYTTGTYNSGTYYRDDTFNWAIGEGNATGGIQGVVLGYQGNTFFQYRFDTVIPKDNTKTFSLTARISWNRV